MSGYQGRGSSCWADIVVVIIAGWVVCHPTLAAADTSWRLDGSDAMWIMSSLRQLQGSSPSLNGLQIDWKDETVTLPDTTLEQTVLGFTLTMDMSQIVCGNISVSDIVVAWNSTYLPTLLQTELDALDFDLDCNMKYTYRWVALSGSGEATIVTAQDYLAMGLDITSNDLSDAQQPVNTSVSKCEAVFNVQDLTFDQPGSLVGAVLNALEAGLRNTVSNLLQQQVCDFLDNSQELLGTLFGSTAHLLAPLLEQQATSNDPLQVENSYVFPPSYAASILNFRNPQSREAALLDRGVQAIGTYLGAPYLRADNIQDLNINRLISNYLLEEGGSFPLNVSSLLAGYNLTSVLDTVNSLLPNETANIVGLSLDTAHIYGLDSFTHVSPLVAVGNYTLQIDFALTDLTMNISGLVDLLNFDNTVNIAPLDLSLTVTKMNASMAMFVAVNLDVLRNLTLGTVLSLSQLDCLFRALQNFTLASMSISSLDWKAPTVSGLEGTGLDVLLRAGVRIVYAAVKDLLVEILPPILQDWAGNLVQALGLGGGGDGSTTSGGCGPSLIGDSGANLDFRDLLLTPDQAEAYGATGTQPYGNLLSFVKHYFDTEYLRPDNTTGQPVLNDLLVRPLTLAQSGTVGTLSIDQLAALDYRFNVSGAGLDAHFGFAVRNLRLENLDTIGFPLRLLDPVRNEPFELNNSLSAGALSLAADLELDVDINGRSTKGNVGFSIAVESMRLIVAFMAKISEQAFLRFPLGYLIDLSCWLATLDPPHNNSAGEIVRPFSIDQFDLTGAGLLFNLTCMECDPSVKRIVELLASLEPQAANKDWNGLLKAVRSLLNSSSFERILDDILMNAPRRCPYRTDYDPNATLLSDPLQLIAALALGRGNSTESVDQSDSQKQSALVAALVVACVGVVGGILIKLLLGLFVARRHRRWLNSLPNETVVAIYDEQAHGDQKEDIINSSTKALILSPQLPIFIRCMVPVMMLASIGLLLSGILGPTVDVIASVGSRGESLLSLKLSISIRELVQNAWTAGGKASAILIVLASGCWPILRITILLALWVIPPQMLSISKRRFVIEWLDFLGKWTLAVIFIILLSSAAFRWELNSQAQTLFPEGFFEIDLVYLPVWGFYNTCLAFVLGQVSSHAMLRCHRRVINDALLSIEQVTPHGESEEEAVEKIALGSLKGNEQILPLRFEQFSRPHRGDSAKLRVRQSVHVVLAVVALVAVVLLVLGCFFPSFSYDILGIVGIAFERAGQRTSYEKSVFAISSALMDTARFVNSAKEFVGLVAVIFLFIATILIIPILLLGALMAQWFISLSQAWRAKLQDRIEILQAWTCVEVYLASVACSAFQIDDLSAQIVKTYCQGFNSAFSTLASLGFLSQEDAQCFEINGSAGFGLVFLAGVVLLIAVVDAFVTEAVDQKSRERSTIKIPELERSEELKMRRDEVIDLIRPVPVLFTDRFRWAMTQYQPGRDE